LSKSAKVYTQIDFRSSFFLVLNNFLPAAIRDRILLKHMGIED
jgi:hypothetical protein